MSAEKYEATKAATDPGAAAENTEGAPAAETPPQTPEEKIAALETEKAELKDRMLRIAAEFENFKRRTRKAEQDAEIKGKESILRDLLEVVDNLDRALAAANASPDTVRQGVELVLRQFTQKFERHEVKAFDSKGQPFDPRVHDAVSQVPSADVAPGTVLSELQRGYRIGEKLLRPALVVVSLAAPTAAKSDDAASSSGEGGAA